MKTTDIHKLNLPKVNPCLGIPLLIRPGNALACSTATLGQRLATNFYYNISQFTDY